MDCKAFIDKVFFATPLDRVWVGWNDGVGGGFPGGPADTYLGRLPPAAGHYFSIGSLKAGQSSRRKVNTEAIHAFVLDDIGTKATDVAGIVEVLGYPSWIIETSSGNYQYGWVYSSPIGRANWRRHRLAILECARRWGTDKAGQDPNRLVRLPSGVNVKPGKGLFAVRLVEVNWEVKLHLVDLLLALGLDWDAPGGEDDPEVDLAELEPISGDDIWVKVLSELGLARYVKPNGFLEIECPWAAGHSAETEGTAYLGRGRFECFHDHCSGRKSKDFKQELDHRLPLVGVLAGVRSPEEVLLEDEYVARKSIAHLFDPPPEPPAPSARAGIPEGLTFADRAEAVARLIFVQAEKVFLDEPTGTVLDKTELEEALWKDPALVLAGAGAARIRRGQRSIINELLTLGTLRRAHHRVYRPGLGRFIADEHQGGVPAVNVWQKSALAEEPAGQWLKVILDHIEGRLFAGDPEEAAIWLDWSAALVQWPEKKINYMPVIVGTGGTGKDMLFSLYGRLVGPKNLMIIGSGLIRNEFTFADAVERQVLMIEELLGGDGSRVDMDNVLKPLIAAPPHTITIRKIRQSVSVVAKVANLVAFTNNIDAMNMGTEEERRRYWIYESKAVALTPDEGKVLAEAVEKGAGEYLGFLMARDLSKWNPYVTPRTAKTTRTADRMMIAAMSGASQHIVQVVEEGELAGRDFILSSELTSTAVNARMAAREAARAIPEAMKKAGFVKWADGKQVWFSDKAQPRVWVRKTAPKDVHEWDVAKMRAAVEAEQQTRTQAMFSVDDARVVPFKKG